MANKKKVSGEEPDNPSLEEESFDEDELVPADSDLGDW
jgi:uncharacterized protein YodC (DUF2158 family)